MLDGPAHTWAMSGGLDTFDEGAIFWLFIAVLFMWMVAHGEKYTTGASARGRRR